MLYGSVSRQWTCLFMKRFENITVKSAKMKKTLKTIKNIKIIKQFNKNTKTHQKLKHIFKTFFPT